MLPEVSLVTIVCTGCVLEIGLEIGVVEGELVIIGVAGVGV
jgi:hypothetical protein